jgi:carbamate kinase
MRIFILSILTLFVFNAYAASTSEFLDSYEEVVDIYVSYADKSQFCNSDNMELLTKVMPKLTQFGQEAQNIQGSFNSDELQRYLIISQKFSTSMQKLSTRMQNISC